jgi:hypothetical protein
MIGFLSLGLAALLDSSLYAGYGFGDISPSEPLPLGGYTERKDKVMDGVGDRLSARVLVLRQGDLRVALVSAEMLTVPGSLYREVVRKAEQGGFRGEILLAATHTHSAPDSQMLNDRMRTKIPGIATFRSRWLDWYSTQIADLILKTRPLFQVGPVVAVEADCPFARFRREPAKGGATTPPKTARNVSFPFGGGKVEVLHFAAHPTLIGHERNTTSGDWPGAWMGWATTRMFFNGAIGDLAPDPPASEKGSDPVERMRHALEQLRWRPGFVASDDPLHPVEMTLSRAEVRMPQATAHPEFARRNGIPDALATTLVRQFAPEKAHVIVVRLGRVAFIGIPGEPTTTVGLRIEAVAKKAGIDVPIVVSFANEWLGYILTREEYKVGGYEATLAMHGPELADRIVEAVEASFSARSSSKG